MTGIELVMGIDPGMGGAIAWQVIGIPNAEVGKMPETRGDMIAMIKQIVGQYRAIAYIEDVVSYIPGGSPSAMFNYGANVERPSCILQTLGVPIIEVRPQKWQKELSLGKSDRMRATPDMNPAQKKAVTDWNASAKREWKGKLKEKAQMLYPELSPTLHTCDALLILNYALKDQQQNIL